MDLEAMQAQIESLQEQLVKMQEGQAELQRKLKALRVTVTSADDLVTATVDARGHVESVQLDPKIYQDPDSRRLAATITATIQQAVGEVIERVTELTRPFVPEEVLRAHMGFDFDRVHQLHEDALVEGVGHYAGGR